MGFGEKNHRGQVPFSSDHTSGTYYQPDLSLLMLILVTWLRYYLSDFSILKLLFFLFSIFYSLERSHYVQLTHKKEQVIFYLLKGGVSTYIIWNYSIRGICLFSLFSELLVSLWTHGYLFYTLSHNPISFYLSFCSNYSSFDHWELFRKAPKSL